MGWIALIESNVESATQIEEALKELDPSAQALRFADSSGLAHWLQQLAKKETEALAQLPEGKLVGIVANIDVWNLQDATLFEKIKTICVQLNIAENVDSIFIVLTGHKLNEEKTRRFQKPWVDNLLAKPFDKLMLKQMLDIARNRNKKVTISHVHRFKTNLTIEMLKEIKIIEITEISFSTLSDQNVEIGRIAKYYSDFLETNQHRSAFARAVNVEQISGSNYQIDLGFFALDQQQSFNLQKMIQKRKRTRPLPTKFGDQNSHEFIFIEGEKTDLCQQIRPSIERFMDHSIVSIKHPNDLTKIFKIHADKGINPHIVLFLDVAHCLGNEIADCQTLFATNNKMSIYLLSKQIYPEAKERELSQACEDIFYAPFNRSYILKTLKRKWPNLRTKEEIYENHDQMERQIHVSNPVKIVEVSEAGLVMEYYRPLPVGSFREFIFWMPVEVEVPVILGLCKFTEPVGKNLHLCHFTFFGVGDHHLKHIRRWMLHNYIDKKSSE